MEKSSALFLWTKKKTINNWLCFVDFFFLIFRKQLEIIFCVHLFCFCCFSQLWLFFCSAYHCVNACLFRYQWESMYSVVCSFFSVFYYCALCVFHTQHIRSKNCTYWSKIYKAFICTSLTISVNRLVRSEWKRF